MLIFIPIIHCRAGRCRRGRGIRAAGLSMDGRTFWSLYQNVTAGARSGGADFMDRIGQKSI